jgi:hypothetical protein
MKARCLLLPLLAILLAGCASNRPMVGAWRGAGFSPAQTDKIALTLRPNPGDADAEAGRILTAELVREGFNLVPLAEADYTLAYAVEDDSVENYVPARVYAVSTPSQTSQNIIAPGMSAPPAFTPQSPQGFQPYIGPTLIVYHTKGIRLYLYTNPKTHPGGLQIAWSGCIDAGEKVSAKREPLLIEALLGHFGQDYVGRVSLPK